MRGAQPWSSWSLLNPSRRSEQSPAFLPTVAGEAGRRAHPLRRGPRGVGQEPPHEPRAGLQTQTREPAERTCPPATSSPASLAMSPSSLWTASAGHSLLFRAVRPTRAGTTLVCLAVTPLPPAPALAGIANGPGQGTQMTRGGDEASWTWTAGKAKLSLGETAFSERDPPGPCKRPLGRGGRHCPGRCWTEAWCLPDSRTGNPPRDVTAKRLRSAHRALHVSDTERQVTRTAIRVIRRDLFAPNLNV